MKLPEISVRRPVTTVMVFAAITLPGCVAFFKLNLDLLPDTVTAQESSPDLYRIVDKQIADPLKRVSGVGAVVYIAGQERQINVYFDREAIEAYNLSVQQIRNVLAAET